MWIHNFKFLLIVFLTIMHISAFRAAGGVDNECDQTCQKLVRMRDDMANLRWRSSFDDTDTKKNI